MTNEATQVKLSSAQIFNAFGVQLQFLIQPSETDGTTSLYRGTLASGTVVPLHSHPEAEVFYLLQGTLEVYQDNGAKRGWCILETGRALAIPGGVKHALRNVASTPATTLMIAGSQLFTFFRKISIPITGILATPTPDDLSRIFDAAENASYWMGSLEENAGIGIALG